MRVRRSLQTGVIVLALIECGAWFIVALFLWSFRDFLAGSHPDVIAQRTNWAMTVLAGAVINSMGLLAFLIRRRGWGWPVFVGVQVGDVVFSSIASVAVEPTWWTFTAFATVVVILLIVTRSSAEGLVPREARTNPQSR